MEKESIWIALSLTMVAGLATGIGSLIAFLAKKTNTRFLSVSMGLSAGVMIYVSFMELMPESVREFSQIYSEGMAQTFMLASFFLGIILIALIDRLVPEEENPHEIHTMEPHDVKGKSRLKRTGVLMALAIGIHNFPEGLATFTTSLTSMDIALPIVFAIAIHNIPEGIAVSVPIYHATGSRKKAFWYSFFSGLSEPVGALFGFLFLLPFWSPQINAFLLSFVSGIMVYISFDELLPGTEKYGHHHLGIFGVVLGMLVMGLSLILLG